MNSRDYFRNSQQGPYIYTFMRGRAEDDGSPSLARFLLPPPLLLCSFLSSGGLATAEGSAKYAGVPPGPDVSSSSSPLRGEPAPIAPRAEVEDLDQAASLLSWLPPLALITCESLTPSRSAADSAAWAAVAEALDMTRLGLVT